MTAAEREKLARLYRAAWEAALDYQGDDNRAVLASDLKFLEALYAIEVTD